MSPAVLIAWIVVSFLWDVAVFGFTAYEVFWHDHSGWWFVLALVLTYQPSLFAALPDEE